MSKSKHYVIAAFATAAAATPVLAKQASAPVAVYQMDLFSIISFGLAIAALIISLLMGWLSWEFYKKSADSSERSQQAVTKIETAVLSIQSEITEIVRQAVTHWTGGADVQDVEQAVELTQKYDELAAQIAAVSDTAANKEELENKFTEFVELQREQTAALTTTIAEAKARAIFPSIADRGPVVESVHTVSVNTEREMSGRFVLEVLRPSRVVTVNEKFAAPFKGATSLNVTLISPSGVNPVGARLSSGIGRHGDFNVHLHPVGGSTTGYVQPGKYVIDYQATNQDDVA